MPKAYMVSSVRSSGPSAKRLAVSLNRLLAPTDSATDVSCFTGASQCALLMSTSLIGRLGQALSGYPPRQCQCRSRARASLRNRRQGPSIMGFEDEVEQSLGRPCRQSDGRSKRTCELTSSIVPRGTSFHRSVELECPPIGFDPARFHAADAACSRVH